MLLDFASEKGTVFNDITGRYEIGDKEDRNICKIRLKLFLAGFMENKPHGDFDEELSKVLNMYQLYGGISPDGIFANGHLNI